MLRHVLPYADIALTSCPLRHLVKDDTNLAYTKGSGEHGGRAVDGIRPTPGGLSGYRYNEGVT